MKLPISIVVIVATLICVGRMEAQVKWVQPTSPGNRGGVAMAFYPPGNYTLLFGGIKTGQEFLGRTIHRTLVFT